MWCVRFIFLVSCIFLYVFYVITWKVTDITLLLVFLDPWSSNAESSSSTTTTTSTTTSPTNTSNSLRSSSATRAPTSGDAASTGSRSRMESGSQDRISPSSSSATASAPTGEKWQIERLSTELAWKNWTTGMPWNQVVWSWYIEFSLSLGLYC